MISNIDIQISPQGNKINSEKSNSVS